MASPSCSYEYFFREAPFTEGELANPPTRNLFILQLKFLHFRQSNISANSQLLINDIEFKLVCYERHLLFADRARFRRTLYFFFSQIGACVEFMESIVSDVLEFACGMIESPENARLEGLKMVVDLKVTTPNSEGEIMDRVASESMESGDVKFTPATKSSIAGLKRKRVTRSDIEDGGVLPPKKRALRSEECRICLDGCSVGQEVCELPCGHAFHSHCTVRWLETSHLCPLCRFPMPTASDC